MRPVVVRSFSCSCLGVAVVMSWAFFQWQSSGPPPRVVGHPRRFVGWSHVRVASRYTQCGIFARSARTRPALVTRINGRLNQTIFFENPVGPCPTPLVWCVSIAVVAVPRLRRPRPRGVRGVFVFRFFKCRITKARQTPAPVHNPGTELFPALALVACFVLLGSACAEGFAPVPRCPHVRRVSFVRLCV